MHASEFHRQGLLVYLGHYGKGLLPVLSFLIAFLCPHWVVADEWNLPCDSVLNLAELNYDSSLIVSVAKDSAGQVCAFYVSLPPSLGGAGAASTAAGTYQSLRKADLRDADAAGIAIDESKFVTLLTEGLLAPLQNKRFQQFPISDLSDALGQNTKEIRACSIEAISSGANKFEPLNNLIACGTINSTFALQVSFKQLALMLLIPAG